MKLEIERAALIRALGHAQSVVERKATIPILANIMLTAEPGHVTLTATDMEIALVETLSTEVTRAGMCTAPAATLYEIARKLPDGALIGLDHPGGDKPLALRAGRYSTSLQVLPQEDFPAMTLGALPWQFTLPAADLRRLIDHARFAMSTEETRYYLCGLYLHTATSDDGQPVLRTAATDGHRLARVDVPRPEFTAGAAAQMRGAIIPRKTVNEIRKLIDETTAPVQIGLSDSRIQVRLETGVLLTSKLIDGTFPEYERVIPRGNNKLLKLNGKAFTAAVSRVATISTDRARPVKLTLSSDRLDLSASSSEIGSAREELDMGLVQYGAAPMEIGFQARYLNDVIEQIGGDVEFRLNDSQSPALVQDASDPSALYVLMPMRV